MEFSPTSPNYIPALCDTVTRVHTHTVPNKTQMRAFPQRARTGCFTLEVRAESRYLGRLRDETPLSCREQAPPWVTERTRHRGADRRDFKERTAVGRGMCFLKACCRDGRWF